MSNAGGPLAGKKGLVLEDEFLIALDLQDVLEAAGAQVTCAGRVSEALEILRETTDLDFAVLDMHLGDTTSIPVARVLAERNIGFVFLSGLGKHDAQRLEFPKALVIEKPYRAAALIGAVAAALLTR